MKKFMDTYRVLSFAIFLFLAGLFMAVLTYIESPNQINDVIFFLWPFFVVIMAYTWQLIILYCSYSQLSYELSAKKRRIYIIIGLVPMAMFSYSVVVESGMVLKALWKKFQLGQNFYAV